MLNVEARIAKLNHKEECLPTIEELARDLLEIAKSFPEKVFEQTQNALSAYSVTLEDLVDGVASWLAGEVSELKEKVDESLEAVALLDDLLLRGVVLSESLGMKGLHLLEKDAGIHSANKADRESVVRDLICDPSFMRGVSEFCIWLGELEYESEKIIELIRPLQPSLSHHQLPSRAIIKRVLLADNQRLEGEDSEIEGDMKEINEIRDSLEKDLNKLVHATNRCKRGKASAALLVVYCEGIVSRVEADSVGEGWTQLLPDVTSINRSG